jgi:hypothetical protein
MNTVDINNAILSTPARSVLEEAPARALVFLTALGTNPTLRAQLAAVGYTADDHTEGWTLFFQVSGYGNDIVVPVVNASAQAIAEIDAWESSGFLRVEAALRHKHPDQERFVFEGLVAGTGADAIGPMATFLDRLDELESGADRKSTRKADKAALDTLAARGIDDKLRKHLRSLVVTATTNADGAAHVPVAEAKRHGALLGLYRWLQDWSDTARAIIKQRVDLITLGLAKRRSKKSKAKPVATPPVVQPPAATPPVAAPPVAQPPAVTPPVAQPPVATPPVAQPPAATPPVAEPPAVTPPVPPIVLPIQSREEEGPASRAA